jgi:hypothetical protein
MNSRRRGRSQNVTSGLPLRPEFEDRLNFALVATEVHKTLPDEKYSETQEN